MDNKNSKNLEDIQVQIKKLDEYILKIHEK
jgi:hypothetical protein